MEDPEAVALARRRLGEWEEDVTDENVKLFLAIREAQSESKGKALLDVRVSKKMFARNRTCMVSTARKIKSYYTAPKAKHPDIHSDPTIAPYVKDPRIISPTRGFNPDEEWLIGKAAPRQADWDEVEASLAIETKYDEIAAPSHRLALENGPVEEVPVTRPHRGATTEDRPAAPTADAPEGRQLKSQDSNVSEGSEIEVYIESCMACFDENLIVFPDNPTEPSVGLNLGFKFRD
jgi:hypothetical protein